MAFNGLRPFPLMLVEWIDKQAAFLWALAETLMACICLGYKNKCITFFAWDLLGERLKELAPEECSRMENTLPSWDRLLCVLLLPCLCCCYLFSLSLYKKKSTWEVQRAWGNCWRSSPPIHYALWFVAAAAAAASLPVLSSWTVLVSGPQACGLCPIGNYTFIHSKYLKAIM